MVELASLHPLEAEGVPAQRRVRHELRLELADGDRHLPTAETAAIDQPRLRKALAAICSFQPGDGGLELPLFMLSLPASIVTIFFDMTSMIVTLLPRFIIVNAYMLIPTISSIVRGLCARHAPRHRPGR